MISAIFYSLIGGIAVALQSVFSARLGEKLGFWEANAFVHGSGFLLAIILALFFGKLDFGAFREVNPIYLTAGFVGVLIVFSISKSVSGIGASYGITIMLVSQILFTLCLNIFGFFGEETIKLSPMKGLGIVLLICGLLIFQLSE